MWSIVAKLLGFALGFFQKKSKEERHEDAARELGRKETRVQAAEVAVQEQAKALETEHKMVDAQKAVAEAMPQKEEPVHEGTDLFDS